MSRKKTTDGLRLKPNGVWEMSQVINGKRKWFSDKDPALVWQKRDDYLRAQGEAAAGGKPADRNNEGAPVQRSCRGV